MPQQQVVEELNREHGLRFELHSRCDSGLQGGAWLLVDPTGRQAILKLNQDGAAARIERLAGIVDRLRSVGYPTPRWLAAGTASGGLAYHVQDFASGAPAYPLTADKARLLVDVLEIHAGLDPDPSRDWSAYVGRVVGDDSADGLRRAVRELGPPGQALLDHYDRLLAGLGPVRLPTGDLVHGDFNTCNILLRDGGVSGVIDVEALGSGTRVVDYAHLLREAYVEGYEPAAAREVRKAAEAVAGPAALARCVASTVFWIVPFKVRHEPGRIDEVLARLHRLADDLAVPF